jgi:hypothetical protein
MPTMPPPPPAPKRSRTNLIIIGAAVAVIAAIITTGIVVVQTRDNEPAAAASTPAADPTITAETVPEPEPEDTEPQILGLTDGASYEDGVDVALSGFKRGVSSDTAAPSGTPYVSFTVAVTNGTGSVLDMGTAYFLCFYGDASQQSEQIFDSAQGLEGLPSMRLRPGRTAKATVACELPKSEAYLQVELSPSMESQAAIFAGDVK